MGLVRHGYTENLAFLGLAYLKYLCMLDESSGPRSFLSTRHVFAIPGRKVDIQNINGLNMAIEFYYYGLCKDHG